MNILIIGNGGREHAIAWKIRKDDPNAKLFCAPGNAGTAAIAENLPIQADNIKGIVKWTVENKPDLTVVGPEVPLCLGLVDELTKRGLPAFGPSKAAAQMEGSKKFAKEVMTAAQVPTARSTIARTEAEARAAVADFGIPVVLKADGLAAGKGVSVCTTPAEIDEAMKTFFVERSFGDAGAEVLVEEFLVGEEASILAFVDGNTVIPLASAQDHKRLLNDDKGPNTGGMGSYSPAPCVTPDLLAVIQSQVFKPVVEELNMRGVKYKGILYAGIMLTKNGPKVLEFNCRFGDPETQSILPRMESSLVDAMFACINGTLADFKVSWSKDSCVCVVMVSGGYPGRYEKEIPVDGLEEASKVEGVTVFHAGTKRLDDMVVTSGGRVLGVTATAPALAEAVARAYQGVLKIRFTDADYRTDIAQRALRKKEQK